MVLYQDSMGEIVGQDSLQKLVVTVNQSQVLYIPGNLENLEFDITPGNPRNFLEFH